MSEWARRSDHLGEVLAVGNPNDFDLEGLQEEVPFGLYEAQHGVDWYVQVTYGGPYHGRPPVEPSRKRGLVSSRLNVDAVVDRALTTLVATPQMPIVRLGVIAVRGNRGAQEPSRWTENPWGPRQVI